MPPKKILKYILDLESVIREWELVIEINERLFKIQLQFYGCADSGTGFGNNRGSSSENYLSGSNYSYFKLQTYHRVTKYDSPCL